MPPAAPARPAPALLDDRLAGFLGELVAALDPAPAATAPARGRPPVLPGLLRWSGLLVGVLRRATSRLDLWRLPTGTGLWPFPRVAVSDDAVYKRRERAGEAAMARLFADLTAVLAARLEAHADRSLAPFAAEVYAVDETALDPVARKLPALRGLPPGDDRLLPGKLAGVFAGRRQLWRAVEHQPDPRQTEQVAARGRAADLAPGALLLFDLGSVAFAWFDDLTDADRWGGSRLRDETGHEVSHVCHQDGEPLDALVWLGAHRADRAEHAVRLVQFRRGQALHRSVTTVRGPRRLPLGEVARLYARRWAIAMAVDPVKTELGLPLLWSAKEAVVLTQVWAVLPIAQILQALRVLVAAAARVDVFEVSLPLLVRDLPQYARRGLDPVAAFAADGPRLGFIRPSRRTQIHAPTIPAAAPRPPPAGLALERTPRYARRKGGPAPAPRPAPDFVATNGTGPAPTTTGARPRLSREGTES